MPRDTELNSILRSLYDDDEKAREKAEQDLRRLRYKPDRFSAADRLMALRAAAQPYPFDRPSVEKVSESLVEIAAAQPEPGYIPIVVELFDRFGSNAKGSALRMLVGLEERDAALAFMEIVRKYAEEGELQGLPIGPLANKPRHADVFFPELLNYADSPNISADVHRLCMAYCYAGLLTSKSIAPHSDQLIRAYRSLADKLRPAQQSAGVTWMWEEGYAESRYNAGVLLDLFGYLPDGAAEPELRSALEFFDPRLKFFAILSLLQLGRPIDAKNVATVAASAEMRIFLYDELRKRDELELFPDQYRTQTALAESDMVQWLTYPTELGRVPDEIELMKIVPVDTGLAGGIYDYYLFRFRTHEPHWAAKEGWIAGTSGPFLRKDAPTTAALGETFSTFTKWEDKSPDEHVGDIQALMEKWRDYHSRRNN